MAWCHDHSTRRHSFAGLLRPIEYENRCHPIRGRITDAFTISGHAQHDVGIGSNAAGVYLLPLQRYVKLPIIRACPQVRNIMGGSARIAMSRGNAA
jgi:hypothetical protein